MKKDMTVYELIVKLGQTDITTDEVVELVGSYPVLSHMVLLGQKGKELGVLLEVSKVVPEMTCDIVEKRLRKSGVKEGKGTQVELKGDGNVSRETSTHQEQKGRGRKTQEEQKKVEEPSVQEDTQEVTTDYDKLSTVKCYELCKSRGIECKTKKRKKFYIDLLVKYDQSQEEWEGSEDEWEE